MLITLEEFDAYSGNCEASDEQKALKASYIESAQNIVSDFLRFDPESFDWTEVTADGVCPAIIKNTVLKIATLHLMEAGENIGITGKSMPDNSRTFINYTSYMKYLRPIQNWRVPEF